MFMLFLAFYIEQWDVFWLLIGWLRLAHIINDVGADFVWLKIAIAAYDVVAGAVFVVCGSVFFGRKRKKQIIDTKKGWSNFHPEICVNVAGTQ